MLENVPGLADYYLFRNLLAKLRKLGYFLDYAVVNINKYGVPQRRRRLVLVGSRLAPIKIAAPSRTTKTVRAAIGTLELPSKSNDALHRIVPEHSVKIKQLIKLIPRDGGSRTDLPKRYQLRCHKKAGVGFKDVYGRLAWDDCSSTITSGCLNPSKGRFLHPKQNRVITPREAALLQTFPRKYKFPLDISKTDLALMIGNALPPAFSRIQAARILKHIKENDG